MSDKYQILKKYWGFGSFRPLQGEIIDSVLAGKDTLALMPTGGGKSLCFQVPALVKEGVCIVVSPLIALMKDQVMNLRKRGIAAAAIFSGMNYRDIDRTLDNAAYGGLKLLYVSPERLATELMRARIKKMRVNLLAVDESHCISQWGYDFRPPYLRIAEVREWMPGVPVLAVTATATPKVADDIQERLSFKQKNVFQKSFARENLSYSVLYEENKSAKLLDILQRIPACGVVYARNRRRTQQVAAYLRAKGVSADFYHAGLEPDIRHKKQEDWMNDRTRVIVSTNAFGMGIDKPDVRIVVHLDLPDNLEAYFQEAGRAGRDGGKSFAVLLFHASDRAKLERQYELAYPPLEEVRRVWRALGSYYQLAVGSGKGESYDFDLGTFANNFKFEVLKAYNCLRILEQSGWITLSEAVYLPPTVKFLMDKEALYDYQIRHRKMDAAIRKILQSHQGGYNQLMVMRDFSKLAYAMKMRPADLTRLLELLHKEGVLEFTPQKDQPQLTFLREKVVLGNLELDSQMYHFRKERQKERMEKALAYAEWPICRSRQLLKYFGEEETGKCGICDVCLGRHGNAMSADEFNRLQNKILNLLRKERLGSDEVLDSFSPKYERKLLAVLDYLYAEEMVVRGDDGKLGIG